MPITSCFLCKTSDLYSIWIQTPSHNHVYGLQRISNPSCSKILKHVCSAICRQTNPIMTPRTDDDDPGMCVCMQENLWLDSVSLLIKDSLEGEMQMIDNLSGSVFHHYSSPAVCRGCRCQPTEVTHIHPRTHSGRTFHLIYLITWVCMNHHCDFKSVVISSWDKRA